MFCFMWQFIECTHILSSLTRIFSSHVLGIDHFTLKDTHLLCSMKPLL